MSVFCKTNLETHCKTGNYAIRCLHFLCLLYGENTAFFKLTLFSIRCTCFVPAFCTTTLKHIVKQAITSYVVCIHFAFCAMKILLL